MPLILDSVYECDTAGLCGAVIRDVPVTNQMSWRELHDLYEFTDELYPRSNFPPRYNIRRTSLSA